MPSVKTTKAKTSRKAGKIAAPRKSPSKENQHYIIGLSTDVAEEIQSPMLKVLGKFVELNNRLDDQERAISSHKEALLQFNGLFSRIGGDLEKARLETTRLFECLSDLEEKVNALGAGTKLPEVSDQPAS